MRPPSRITAPMDYLIRPVTAADEPLLWEMLYQALQRSESAAPSREIVRRPEFARYVEQWGRPGDVGFVAYDPNQDQALGAVWYRAFMAEPRSDRPPEAQAPELAFAVRSGHRRRGIGAALLTHWVRANPEQSAVSLQVNPENPAVRLYERFGFRVVAAGPGFVTMRREG